MRIRIVGAGIAGTVTAMQAVQHGHEVEVWHQRPPSSSLVASGIYNPVVLKRLKLVWNAHAFMDELQRFYPQAWAAIGYVPPAAQQLIHRLPDQGHQNDWTALSDSASHGRFLGDIREEDSRAWGLVTEAGWLDTRLWLSKVLAYLTAREQCEERGWTPRAIDNIPTILCQGWHHAQTAYGIPQSAFAPVKGEVLIVRLKNYEHAKEIVHGGIFILPLGDGLYKVGATYAWDELDELPSERGRLWLLERLKKLWNGEVEVVDQKAAVRPAVRDRKPILGKLPNHGNVYVLNGLGSRGTLMAPLLAKWILEFMENARPLPKEVDIQRFF